MKKVHPFFSKTISILAQAIVLMLTLNACEKQSDQVALQPTNKNARNGSGTNVLQCPPGQHWDYNLDQCVSDDGGCPDGYVYDDIQQMCVPQGTNLCAAISDNNITSRERNRAVQLYGNDGGYLFDQINNSSGVSYSSQVSNYLTQIKGALNQGGQDYVNSLGSCNTCQGNYNSFDFLNRISNFINPVRTAITNDGALTTSERAGLLAAIQAIYDNFDEIGQIVESRERCFPDPPGYGPSVQRAEQLDGGDMITQGFFSSIVKAIKKVVQIVVTVITSVVDYALLGAVGGFLLGGGSEAGFILGGAAGAIYGLVRGIKMAARGQYTTCFIGICI